MHLHGRKPRDFRITPPSDRNRLRQGDEFAGGVSRATLWRMIKGGLLKKIEALPGSFRLCRADLEAIAAGHKKIAPQ